MVSALVNACSTGDFEAVVKILSDDASKVDIEVKDQTGCTPLIEAIKNGHVEIVKTLLDSGADPITGQLDQYTTDTTILETLQQAREKVQASKDSSSGVPSNEGEYTASAELPKEYYNPPHGAYPYFPTLNAMPPPEGHAYYPSHQAPGEHPQQQDSPINLPPPDIARMIPCRYFPACRYGASCMFLHPQPPYFQGPPPPSQYPAHYDPMSPPTYPPYYGMPQSGYPPHPANGAHPMSPTGGPHQPQPPHPGMVHARSSSEVVSPMAVPYAPSGPPPMPYGAPLSPPYPHAGPPPVPMSMPPPMHHQPPPPPQQQSSQGPVSPSAYTGPPPAPYPSQYPGMGPGPMPNGGATAYPDVNGVGPKSPQERGVQHADGHHGHYRDGSGYNGNNHNGHGNRRGGFRRTSFGGRKPPCIFFPAGKCKNGDDCRFPHIMPDAMHMQKGLGMRNRAANGNGIGTIEEKMGQMSVRDGNSNGSELAQPISRAQSMDNGYGNHRNNHRGPPTGPKNQHHHHAGGPNGAGPKADRKQFSAKPQRVPNADEFPVLGESTTPRARSPGSTASYNSGSGHQGPTAAQVLQRPAPARKDSARDVNGHDTAPANTQVHPMKESKSEPNGMYDGHSTEPIVPLKAPVTSFAAIASAVPDTGKEVSVTA